MGNVLEGETETLVGESLEMRVDDAVFTIADDMTVRYRTLLETAARNTIYDMDDLRQEIRLQLLLIQAKKPVSDVSSTVFTAKYFRKCAYNHISSLLRSEDRLSREMRADWIMIRKTETFLSQKLGREASETELASTVGLSLARLRQVLQAQNEATLVLVDGQTRILNHSPSVEEIVLEDADFALLRKAYDLLGEDDQQVVALRLHGQKWEEIGKTFGITAQGAAHRYEKACSKLATTCHSFNGEKVVVSV